MDRIILRGARFSVHLGVPPHERSVVQEVILDVEVEFDTRKAAASDHFADTVDYAAIHETVHQAATGRPYSLVESMAGHIADAILAAHPVEGVRVLLRKPAALRDRGVDWTGVEIIRRRHG